MHVYVYLYMYVYVYVYTYMYEYVYMYVYVHMLYVFKINVLPCFGLTKIIWAVMYNCAQITTDHLIQKHFSALTEH